MRASLFLFIYAVIALVFVFRILSVLFGRSRPSLDDHSQQTQRQRHQTGQNESPRVEFFDFFSQGGDARAPHEKGLNCHFQYGGQTYDAFEVLGIPAGAPREFWQEGYRNQLGSKKQPQELLEAAIKALQTTRFS